MSKYNKILVIGSSPGAGKTYVSRIIHQLLNKPLYHLDSIFWVSSSEEIDERKFIEIQKNILGSESWIIDGCFISTLKLRIEKADLIVYVNAGLFTCLYRIIKDRVFFKKIRPEFNDKNVKAVDLDFLFFIVRSYSRRKKNLQELLDGVNCSVIYINKKSDVSELVKFLK